MPGDLACRLVIRLACRIVRPNERTNWRVRWTSGLRGLQVLVGRGEFPRETSTEMGWVCRAACADAFRTRCVSFDLQKWLRGPRFCWLQLTRCYWRSPFRRADSRLRAG